ncbi:MAG: hypothetical protein ACRDJ2_16995, partial [Actinomycetota bacterium]
HNSVAPDGIQPDIAAARTAETPPEEDAALDAALAFLADQPIANEADADPATPTGSPSASGADHSVIGVVGLRTIC